MESVVKKVLDSMESLMGGELSMKDGGGSLAVVGGGELEKLLGGGELKEKFAANSNSGCAKLLAMVMVMMKTW